MLTEEEKIKMLPVVQALEAALFSQRDTVYSLLEAYRKAHRSSTGSDNEVNEESLKLAVQASSLGLATLCEWLMEAGKVLDTRYWNKAIEYRQWLDKRLEEANITIAHLRPL